MKNDTLIGNASLNYIGYFQYEVIISTWVVVLSEDCVYMVRWTWKDENLRSQGESESVSHSIVSDPL